MFLLPEIAQQIVDEIKTTINRDLNIMDKDGVIVASTDRSRIGTLHTVARDLLCGEMDCYVVLADDMPPGCRRGINLPITINGERVGVVGITGEPSEVSGLGKVIQKMTEIMLVEVQQQSALNYMETVRRSFIERLLFGDMSDERDLRATASALDFALHLPRVAAVFAPAGDALAPPLSPGADGGISALRVAQTALGGSRSVCVPINGELLVLFEESTPAAAAARSRAVCRAIRDFTGAEMCCGIGQCAADHTQLARAYRQALTACHVARASGERIAVFDERSLPFVVQSIPAHIMRALVDSAFAGCGAEERGELLDTLALYYKHGGSTAAAAAEVFIHPNSFLYRLNKVKAKTGMDPRVPRDCCLLGLIAAYRVLQGSEH